MNVVTLVGRLTRDPDIRQSQGENPTTIARYTIAVDRRRAKDGEQSADFISTISFGKTAEFVEKYLKKGTKICVRGRIQTGSFTNKDGQKVYTTDVVAEDIEFAESKKTADGQPASSAPAEQDSAPVAQGSAPADNMDMPPYNDEELPFS